jgi:hypothetical protein
MEAFVVACSLLVLAGLAVLVVLGVTEMAAGTRVKLPSWKRTIKCPRCGQPLTYSWWRKPPWCRKCEADIWRAA